MDRETRLNNHLKEIRREMSTLKGEIEELKSAKLESGPLEEQDESKKRLRKRKKRRRRPLKRAQRRERADTSASHVLGRRKTPLSKHSRQEVTKMLKRVV